MARSAAPVPDQPIEYSARAEAEWEITARLSCHQFSLHEHWYHDREPPDSERVEEVSEQGLPKNRRNVGAQRGTDRTVRIDPGPSA